MSSNYVELVRRIQSIKSPAEVVDEQTGNEAHVLAPRVGQLRRDAVKIVVKDQQVSLPQVVAQATQRTFEISPGGPVIQDLRSVDPASDIQQSNSSDPNLLQAEVVVHAFNAIPDFRRPSQPGVKSSVELAAEALSAIGYENVSIHNLFEEVDGDLLPPERREVEVPLLASGDVTDRWKVATVSIGGVEQSIQPVEIDQGLVREFQDSRSFFYRSVEIKEGQVSSSGTIHFSLKKAA